MFLEQKEREEKKTRTTIEKDEEGVRWKTEGAGNSFSLVWGEKDLWRSRNEMGKDRDKHFLERKRDEALVVIPCS